MRKNRIFGMLSATALLFAGACSNDVIDPGSQAGGENGVNPEDGVYLAVNFDLPTAKETRSYTEGENSSNDGTEVGHDDENKVSSALVVLAKLDNSFIAAAYSEDTYPMNAEQDTYRTTTKISKTNLSRFYASESFDTDDDHFNLVNVYVFANPTAALKNYFSSNGGVAYGDKNWVNTMGKYDVTKIGSEETRIWAPNHFLMANSIVCTRRFPSDLAEWNNYNTDNSAFNLTGMNNYGRPNEVDNLTNRGNIPVERVAARYDFRDGALDGGNGLTNPDFNGFAAQSYHMILDSDSKPLIDMYLGKMSLVNMNQDYYFLRRVSDNGYNEGSTLLGIELPWYANANGQYLTTDGNYVVDAMADWKCAPGATTAPQSGYSDVFNYPFFTENDGKGEMYDNLNEGSQVDISGLGSSSVDGASSRWYTSMIANVLEKGKPDNWSSSLGNKQYRTWRYLTEGTIPGIESQKNSVSNGIVFKGLMKPAALTPDEAAGKDYFTQLLLKTLELIPDENKGSELHHPIIYVFQNHLYCSWEHIRRTAIYLSITDLIPGPDNKWTCRIDRTTKIYTAVFGNGGFGSVTFTLSGDGDLKDANFLINPDDTEGVLTLVDDELAPEATSANSLYQAWKEKFPTSDEYVGENEAEEMQYFTAFRDQAVNVGKITMHQESYDKELGGWGYYCYYYYWNRHNDNGQDGVMGPMEFAVVRNNVYKLAVTKISAPGHPGITANDPDKPTPNTPDEQGDVYITVSCKTLPWVVRENNIVF